MSDNFYSRYLDGEQDDPADAQTVDDETTTPPPDEESTEGARHADPDVTSVVDRAEIEAALAEREQADVTSVVDRAEVEATLREAARRRGQSAPPPSSAASSPDSSWPGEAGGRHGYDTAGRGDDRAPDQFGAGRAFSAPSPADLAATGGHDRDVPPAGGRHGPGGPSPQGPPAAPGVPRYSGGQQGAPPEASSYPPNGARPLDAAAGPARRGPYSGPPPPGYVGGGGAQQRGRVPLPADDHDASVGDMRAQIRESQVAPPYKPVPQMGWRKRVYHLTHVNLGLSANERYWNDLRRRLRVNLRGKYVIAVMGAKGGVNKTTATVCLGAALKRYRDDKIVAIDANPASGNLAQRIDEPVSMSWRGLINDPNLREYTDFRSYLGKDSSSGLEVLGSDPGDEVLTGEALAEAWRRLQVQYPIALVDCGNQIRDDITHAILQWLPVDAIVVPSTTRLDGALGAADTLNWLLHHGYPHLVREAVVVVSNINKVDASDQVRGLHEDFERAVRAVHDVPFDQHLSDAVAIDFDRLSDDTRQVYIEAAASLVDGFAGAADRESGRVRWPHSGGPA